MLKLILVTALAVLACPGIVFGQVYASVDTAAVFRSIGSDNVFQRGIVELTDNNGVPLGVFQVTADNRLSLDLDSVAGGRAVVGIQSGDIGLEASFLQTTEWDTLATVTDAGGMLASPFSAIGATPSATLDSNTFASVAYETQLMSADASFTYLACCGEKGSAVYKFGVRSMTIDEQFDYFSTNAVQDNTLLSVVQNRLIGPQVAIQSDTPLGAGSVALRLSGCVAHNSIERVSTFNGATTVAGLDRAALIGEAGIEYLHPLTPHVAVRAGYQVMGAGGIGLATNDPLITPDQTATLLYQLPYLGVSAVW